VAPKTRWANAGDVKFDPRVIVSDMVATDPSVKNISCGL